MARFSSSLTGGISTLSGRSIQTGRTYPSSSRAAQSLTRNIEISPDGARIVNNVGPFGAGICTNAISGCPLQVLGLDPLSSVAFYSPLFCTPSSDCWVGAATWLDNDHIVFPEVDGASTVERELNLTSGLVAPFLGSVPIDLGRSPTSPDGRQEVYLAHGSDGSNQVFVANADGSSPVMITSFPAPLGCDERAARTTRRRLSGSRFRTPRHLLSCRIWPAR